MSGFQRGAVVRHIFSPRRNMLVVRDLYETVVCVVVEDDKPGSLRLREFPAIELSLVLDEKAANRIADLEQTFDIVWKADMRASERWQADDPAKRKLVFPDRTDLVVYLLGMLDRLAPGWEQVESTSPPPAEP